MDVRQVFVHSFLKNSKIRVILCDRESAAYLFFFELKTTNADMVFVQKIDVVGIVGENKNLI